MPNRVKVFPIKTEEEPTTAAEYKSVELSPALENIPVTKRSCTDAIWCFSFLFVFGALIACGVYTFITGEFKYVGRVYDSDGKLCGIDSGYEDYSYLYYPIPGIKYTTQTVCIKTCPVSPLASSLVGLYKTNSLFTNTIATANDPTVIATSLSSGSSLSGNFYMYDTLTFADQLCMPQKFGTTFTPLSNELVALDIFGQWMGDLRKTWDVIAVAIGIAVLAGLIFTSLMTCQSGVFFIIGLLLTLASLAGSGWMLSTKEDNTQSAIADTTDEISSESIISKNNLAKVVIGFTFWGIACLVYLSLLLFYKKLLMANNLMKAAAADYIRKTWTVFLFAIFMALVLFIFFAFWTMGVYCLVGFGDITSIKAIPFGSALFDMKARYLFIFFVFTFFWISQFFCAMTQYVIASSASHWYFLQGTEQPAKSIILTSLGKALRYHPGSLAWGSLITTLLVPLKMIFCILGPDPYEPKQKKGKFDMLLCKCGCLLSFKRFLATMDDSAYIQMAITGKTFYQSGREAFSLNVRNNHRMKPLRETGYIYTLYAKIFFASVATVAALAALTFLDMFSTKIYSPVVTAVLVFVFSYVISSNFTTIYGVAIDTLLMCSIIEDERYRTSNVAIKHCPKALRLLVFRAQRVTKHEKVAEEDGL